jgi:hypothetical protein
VFFESNSGKFLKQRQQQKSKEYLLLSVFAGGFSPKTRKEIRKMTSPA